MKIDSIRSLERLMKACRRNGVTAIEIDGIKLNLLEMKPKAKSSINAYSTDPLAQAVVPRYSTIPVQESQDEAITTSNEDIDVDQLSEDQALFYSARTEPQ
jgi:hypothetical protein